jgi:hypothetical protein
MFLKRQQGKRNNKSPSRGLLCRAALAVSLLISTAVFAVDKVQELQERFDRESRASDKIKTLDHLADAQFQAESHVESAGDFLEAGLIFEKYRDNVRAAFELLKKQEPDAEKHSNPYRHLELQVRRGIREVEETLLVAPQDVRPPLEIVRKDIVDIDDELIRLLFPRRTKVPSKRAEKAAPPPPEAKP